MGTTKQIQKARVTETATKSAIIQKQSVDVVQTLLYGGLSSLSYLRELFPKKAFDLQFYSMIHGIPSCDDFATGRLAQICSAATDKPRTKLQILRRNRSKRADKFLDWLEKGAFVALRDGRLQAVQVYVHAESGSRNKVLEAYTFTVKYHPNPQTVNMVAGIEFGSPAEAPITVDATNSGLQSLLRTLIDLCQKLPDLPSERYVSMNLFYLPRDGQEYRPEGFEPSAMDELLFPLADGWEKHSETLGQLPSAFHSTTLRITHLQQPAQLGLSEFSESVIPSQFNYNTKSSRIEELGLDLTNLTSPDRQDNGLTEASTSHTVSTKTVPAILRSTNEDTRPPILEPSIEVGRRQLSATDKIQTHNITSILQDGLDTQSSNVPNMKKALQEMLQPERYTQGDTQSQTLMFPHPQADGKPENLDDCTASKTSARLNTDTGSRLALLAEIRAQLKVQKLSLQQNSLKLAQVSKPHSKEVAIIYCQCGHGKEEGETIKCSYCNTWQHVHCYGFSCASDPRMPDEHACYQCLLAGRDDTLLKQMEELVLKRRAMIHSLKHGVKKKSDLAKALGVSVANADDVIKYLREANFITATANSHKSGFGASGKPLFVPKKEGASRDKMLQDLFDPLLHLEAYYYSNTSRTSTLAGQQLLSLVSANMPQPATPRGERWKQATPSTASGLDFGASVTPYKTPTRDRQHLKRGRLEDDDVFATPAKRAVQNTSNVKRLHTVQTQCMLKADENPSSPAPR